MNRKKIKIGCVSFLGFLSIIFLLFYFFLDIMLLFLILNFKRAGGAQFFRERCHELKPILIESQNNRFFISKLDLPTEDPLHKLYPRFLSIGTYGKGMNYYHINVSGGFFHAGYLILETKDEIPNKSSLNIPKNWTIKYIGNGVFVYLE